jgi:lysozyme family protein
MFADNLTHILRYEGGYSNDKDDPGGSTNFGITQKTYDAHNTGKAQKDVKAITAEEVKEIYEKDYWFASKCHKIVKTHPNTTLCHFDCAVNQGVGAANHLIQRAVNKALVAAVIVEDGIIGEKTLLAVDRTFDNHLLKHYLALRKDRYATLIHSRPVMGKFRASWYHRLNDIAKQAKIDWKAEYEAGK